MRIVLLIFSVIVFGFAVAVHRAQTKKPDAKKSISVKKTPTPTPKKAASTSKKAETKSAAVVKKPVANKPKPKPTPEIKDEKAELEKAFATDDPELKIKLLTTFLAEFPKSEQRTRALESITAARVAIGEGHFESGDRIDGLKFYRKAIEDAPVPYSEKLFKEIIVRVPASLYFRGEQKDAIEIATLIEKNVAANVLQLLSLANFYLSIENPAGARRLAESVIKIDEKSSPAFQVLGTANRMNFDLDAAEADFVKALELDPESTNARRGLADMKRALGKPAEALALYDELIAKDVEDLPAQTGRIMSLFETGKRSEAEAELSKAIEAVTGNFVLLANAAYWYAANGENAKAIDLSGKAIAAEPRFVWAHIALARAMINDGRFTEAEQVLLKAKSYGNFPTIEFEIAAARYAGGFYREAADELRKSFIVKNGTVSTKLGRRVEKSGSGFLELLALERKSSILAPQGAERKETDEHLKALVEFNGVLAEKSPDATKAAALADAFVNGTDKMRYHRQIFAANELLKKHIAPATAFELSRTSIASVDDGLDVAMPAAPIMAEELYESRTAAVAAGRYVLVPDVSKQTLSAIARGRIEEIAGLSLIQQKDYAEAAIRLRRAISVLPEKSIWWRSSLWKLGTALEADGKPKEALDAYVKNYNSTDPDAVKYIAVASVYEKINGSIDGLESLIGPRPKTAVDQKAEETVKKKAVETKDSIPEKGGEIISKSDVPKPLEEKPPVKTEIPDDADSKIEDPKPSDVKPIEEKKAAKPLFEPVIIDVKKDNAAPQKKKEEPEETKPPKPVIEKAVEEKTEVDQSGNGRPRIVEGKEISTDGQPPCSILVSQENISLIGGGGSIGILVEFDGGGDPKQITAVSSSPTDISVSPDADPLAGAKQLLFYIRSLTPVAGEYQVSFSAPCGKKELTVKVR
ncbi:MAG: tetratricopeptide repeat protein [Pyrinomonadaceae bacterium]